MTTRGDDQHATAFDPRTGLCSACEHARRIVSGRGSTFWMCGRAKDDPRFRKYPPLPVTRCDGFESGQPGG